MGELASKIRAKYPGAYDGIGDSELESKVVAKYPGVYDHLVGNKPDFTGMDTMPAHRPGQALPVTTGQKIKRAAKSALRTAMPYVRPVLEGGGATLGAVVGAGGGGLTGLAGGPAAPGTVPYGAITGGVAGAGLGYASGAKLSDIMETMADANTRPQPTTTLGQLGQSLSDVRTGANYEMGGQIAGHLLGLGMSTTSKYVNKNTLKDLAKTRARDVFNANKELTPLETQNVVDAAKLTQKLKVKLTPSQMTGKPSLAAIEQGLATADPEFAAILNAQDSKAKQAALMQIRESMGKGKPLPTTQDTQTTGSNIVSRIKSALEPVKKAEREAWAKVPNYPIPSTSFDDAVSSLKKTPMVADTETAVKNIINYAERMPKTTEGLQSIERTINDKMFAPNADPNTKRVLGQLKKAITNDFESMGIAAETGDIALYEGKVIYPSKVQSEIKELEKNLLAATSRGASLKEQNSDLYQFLQKNGESMGLMQNVGVSDELYNQTLKTRLARVQAKGIGVDYQPPASASNQQAIDNFNAGIAQRKSILENLQPAEDVSSAYRSAKDVSKSRFEQFGKGTTDKILKAGNELSGLRIADENIAKQFFTPSGSKGLIRAIGKSQAQSQMKPFVIADMIKTAAPDGVNYNVQSGIRYIQKNRGVLEQLGLTQDAKQILKDQLPQEIERILAKRAPDATGGQFFTPQDMRGILQKYGNTIKQLYGPQTLQSFRDYNSLMTMIDRKNVTTRGMGSNTAEKAMNLANLMTKESTEPLAKLADGLLMALGKGAGLGTGAGVLAGGGSLKTAAVLGTLNTGRQVIKNANNQVAHAFVKILKDATLNPQIASDLMKFQRTGKIPTSLQTIIDKHLITGASITGTPQEQQP